MNRSRATELCWFLKTKRVNPANCWKSTQQLPLSFISEGCIKEGQSFKVFTGPQSLSSLICKHTLKIVCRLGAPIMTGTISCKLVSVTNNYTSHYNIFSYSMHTCTSIDMYVLRIMNVKQLMITNRKPKIGWLNACKITNCHWIYLSTY